MDTTVVREERPLGMRGPGKSFAPGVVGLAREYRREGEQRELFRARKAAILEGIEEDRIEMERGIQRVREKIVEAHTVHGIPKSAVYNTVGISAVVYDQWIKRYGKQED